VSGALLALALSRNAEFAPLSCAAQSSVGLNTRTGAFTNANYLNPTNALTLTAGGVSNVLSQGVQVFRDRGLAILPTFQAVTGTSASPTGSVTFNFDVSADRTNWSNTMPVQFSMPCNGTNLVRGYTNVPKTSLDNAYWIRLTSIGTALTNTIVVSNVVYSVYP
jgi:hypothetical protein